MESVYNNTENATQEKQESLYLILRKFNGPPLHLFCSRGGGAKACLYSTPLPHPTPTPGLSCAVGWLQL